MNSIPKFLIIQTAFIGDVVLALPVAQALKKKYPDGEIHFLVRKGNESLLENHPAISKVWVWDKKQNKLSNLFKLIKELRTIEFEQVINLHRFASSGFITMRMRAKAKIGFDKNPLSRFYTKKVKHEIPKKIVENYLHEVDRNLSLIDEKYSSELRPQLYPSQTDFDKISSLTSSQNYFIIAPATEIIVDD